MFKNILLPACIAVCFASCGTNTTNNSSPQTAQDSAVAASGAPVETEKAIRIIHRLLQVRQE